jgi:hypothetical protein
MNQDLSSMGDGRPLLVEKESERASLVDWPTPG